MAIQTASLTSTATTLDSGSSESVWVKNTGTTRVTVTSGAQTTYIRAGRQAGIPISGATTARVLTSDGGSGTISYEVQGSRQTAGIVGSTGTTLTTTAQVAADAAVTNTYASIDATNGGPAPVQTANLRQVFVKLAASTGGTPSRVKVMCVGDSYGEKLWAQAAPLFARTAGGVAGGVNTGTANTGALNQSATSGTVTANAADYDAAITGLTTTLATSATVSYTHPATPITDTVKVYYVVEDPANNLGGGTFKLQINTVDVAGFTNVSATGSGGSSPTLGIATATVTRASNTLKIVNLTGKVRILHVGFEDSLSAGSMTINVGQGGISLDTMMGQAPARAIFQGVLADLLPDLLLFEMKEVSDYGSGNTYATRLAQFFALCAAGAPKMDVVGIGSPPVSEDGSGRQADQVVQNTQLKTACAAAGYVYFDSYSMFKPTVTATPAMAYALLTALGWNGDGTHVTTTADQYRAMVFLDRFGLLSPYGRPRPTDLNAAVAQTDRLVFNKTNSATPELAVLGDSSNLDAYFLAKRWIRFYDPTQTTQYCLLALDGSRSTYLPQFTGFGSGNAKIKGNSSRTLNVVGGDNDNQPGEVGARAFIPTKTSATLASNGAVAMDAATAGVFRNLLQANATSSTLTNPSADGHPVAIEWVQDATGGRTYTWPTNCRFAASTAPSDTTLSTMTRVAFEYDNSAGKWVETARAVAVPVT